MNEFNPSILKSISLFDGDKRATAAKACGNFNQLIYDAISCGDWDDALEKAEKYYSPATDAMKYINVLTWGVSYGAFLYPEKSIDSFFDKVIANISKFNAYAKCGWFIEYAFFHLSLAEPLLLALKKYDLINQCYDAPYCIRDWPSPQIDLLLAACLKAQPVLVERLLQHGATADKRYGPQQLSLRDALASKELRKNVSGFVDSQIQSALQQMDIDATEDTLKAEFFAGSFCDPAFLLSENKQLIDPIKAVRNIIVPKINEYTRADSFVTKERVKCLILEMSHLLPLHHDTILYEILKRALDVKSSTSNWGALKIDNIKFLDELASTEIESACTCLNSYYSVDNDGTIYRTLITPRDFVNGEQGIQERIYRLLLNRALGEAFDDLQSDEFAAFVEKQTPPANNHDDRLSLWEFNANVLSLILYKDNNVGERLCALMGVPLKNKAGIESAIRYLLSDHNIQEEFIRRHSEPLSEWGNHFVFYDDGRFFISPGEYKNDLISLETPNEISQ